MLVLGLTGSLAMGKSTAAAIFAGAGVAVFDADAAVHALYAGIAAPLVEAAFPGTTADGAVDRQRLGARIAGDQAALALLEGIVHPLVRAAENTFRARAAAGGRRIVLLDVPLLLETGGETRVDAVIVVSTDPETQRRRIMARPGMTENRVAALLARQMPDAEKRKRAHFVVDTGGTLAATQKQIGDVLRAVAGLAAVR